MMKYFLLLFVFFVPGFNQNSFAQEEEKIDFITKLSLANVVDLAIHQSSSVKYAQNRNVNYYWRWQNFKTRFRPELTLSGSMPIYSNSINENIQDDGSTNFIRTQKLNTPASLSLQQRIAETNTYLSIQSSVNRVQDFIFETTKYAGTPVSIGIWQPIFQYNWARWAKRTEPLVYEEANKNFNETIEEISLEATKRFFYYLKVQTNYALAETNLANSRDNLNIADAKKKLGQISENDYSRIKLSVFNAQKSLNTARMDLKNADFSLKSYIGIDQDTKISLEIPLNMVLFDIDPDKALAEAKENRKETPLFERRLIDADRQLDEAKKNSGLNATISANYGLSNSAEDFPGVYDEPDIAQYVKLSLEIPILDWGRSASSIKMAESSRDLIIFDVDKDKRDFERRIVVQVEQFSLLKDQMITAEEADKVAENGYMIALKKFQNGEISITDLNISLSERERAKRDYIESLEDYWKAYYNLRILTLYDFEMNRKIDYDNPMLD